VQDSYIMKLFDRSVDLAQFSHDTPLYPVCRAWIHNLSQLPTTTEQPQFNEPPDDGQVSADLWLVLLTDEISLSDAGYCCELWVLMSECALRIWESNHNFGIEWAGRNTVCANKPDVVRSSVDIISWLSILIHFSLETHFT